MLNAAADEEADRGARGGALPMVLNAELPALFFTAPAGAEPLADRLLHISGSVGGAFAANERRALLDRWARQSQGAMLRAARSPVLALMRLVRRGRSPHMFDFLLQMLVRQTPTPDRVTYGGASRSIRTTACPLCRGPSGSAHILRCRAVIAERRIAVARASDELCRVVRLSAVSGFHPDGGRSLELSLPHLRFFDPSVRPSEGPLPSDLLRGRVPPHWAARVDAVHASNRDAGALGVLPVGFRALLVPRAPGEPSRAPTHRALVRSLDEGIAELQLVTLREAWSVYLAYIL